MSQPQELIYYEGDELNQIYFLKKGSCEYVLPKYDNAPYIRILEHSCFGLIDFIVALLDATAKKPEGSEESVSLYQEPEDSEDFGSQLFSEDLALGRSFTVRASPDQEASELLSINKGDLFRMKTEFSENFAEFLRGASCELQKTICLLYTSPSPRDKRQSRMPSSA